MGEERRESRRGLVLTIVLVVLVAELALCATGSAAAYLYLARPWVRPPAGTSEKAGVVRVVVHSVEILEGGDSARLSVSVENLRPFWELDGEFYVDEFWLEDGYGEQVDEDYEIEWDEDQQDYVTAGGYSTFTMVFTGLASDPKVLCYEAYETSGETIAVPLPPPTSAPARTGRRSVPGDAAAGGLASGEGAI